MRYTAAMVRKAIAGGVVSAATALGTAAAAGADPTDWTTYAGALGAGLLAFAAVFRTENAPHEPAPVPASPSEQVSTGMQQAIQNKADAESGVAVADAELNRIKDVADSMLGTPVGPLAQAAIDSVRTRTFGGVPVNVVTQPGQP